VTRRLTIADRGPGWSYRPDGRAPSMDGEHQPGIETPQLDHSVLAAFDISGDARATLAAWARTAGELMRSQPHELTITLGLGPSAFAQGGGRPAALRDVPPFPGDALEPAISGGDACILAAATTPERARTAAESVSEGAPPRWSQAGFVDRSSGHARDLLGFRDGTMNLRRGRDIGRHVWVESRDVSWMVGGTYLVVRRIRIDIGAFGELGREGQERVIGRDRESGIPLGGRRDGLFDPTPVDSPHIPPGAHARVATSKNNAGIRLLRRSYAYRNTETDAGLLFMTFCRDPRRQFVPVQQNLAQNDALNAFATHVGSAVFAIPPPRSL
jgi:deferrochelatase/peroxidase EfeB